MLCGAVLPAQWPLVVLRSVPAGAQRRPTLRGTAALWPWRNNCSCTTAERPGRATRAIAEVLRCHGRAPLLKPPARQTNGRKPRFLFSVHALPEAQDTEKAAETVLGRTARELKEGAGAPRRHRPLGASARKRRGAALRGRDPGGPRPPLTGTHASLSPRSPTSPTAAVTLQLQRLLWQQQGVGVHPPQRVRHQRMRVFKMKRSREAVAGQEERVPVPVVGPHAVKGQGPGVKPGGFHLV